MILAHSYPTWVANRTSCRRRSLPGSETLYLGWCPCSRWHLYQYLKSDYTLVSQIRLYSVHHVFPTQHCDTSMPPPPIPPPAPSQAQQQQAAPPSPLSCCAEDKPLTFDSARLNARRKERCTILIMSSHQWNASSRLRSPRTSLSEIADLGSPRPVCNPGSQAIRWYAIFWISI